MSNSCASTVFASRPLAWPHARDALRVGHVRRDLNSKKMLSHKRVDQRIGRELDPVRAALHVGAESARPASARDRPGQLLLDVLLHRRAGHQPDAVVDVHAEACPSAWRPVNRRSIGYHGQHLLEGVRRRDGRAEVEQIELRIPYHRAKHGGPQVGVKLRAEYVGSIDGTLMRREHLDTLLKACFIHALKLWRVVREQLSARLLVRSVVRPVAPSSLECVAHVELQVDHVVVRRNVGHYP
jgi:hypothetical protein